MSNYNILVDIFWGLGGVKTVFNEANITMHVYLGDLNIHIRYNWGIVGGTSGIDYWQMYPCFLSRI